MFILDAVRALPPQELKQLNQRIKFLRRDTLDRLYSTVKVYRRNSKTPSRKELFSKTFGTPYSQKQDYRLRKEIQLLRKQITQFMLDTEVRKELEEFPEKRDLYYFRSLKHYKLFEEMKRFAPSMNRNSPATSAQYTRHEKFMDLVSFSHNHMPLNDDTMAHIGELLVSARNSLSQDILYRFRYFDSICNFHTVHQLSISNTAALEERIQQERKDELSDSLKNYLTGLIAYLEDLEDDYSKYYKLSAKLYFSHGDEAIEILHELSNLLDRIDISGFDNVDRKIITEGNLGVALVHAGRGEEAEKHFLAQIEHSRIHGHSMHRYAVNNLVYYYIQHRQFEKGLQLIKSVEESLADDEVIDILHVRAAFCHLFLGNGKYAVMEILDVTKKLGERFKLQHRIIHAIAFYLDGDFDLAINEINKLIAVMKSREVENGALYEKTMSIYRKFFNMKAGRENNAESYKRLEDEIEQTIQVFQLRVMPIHVQWILENVRNH